MDREQQLLREIAENEKRKDFTPSERVAYGKELEQIERLKAKERQTEGRNQYSPKDKIEPSPPTGGNPKARETDYIVGKKVGMAENTYRKAKRIVESGNKELIEKMDKGEIGISTATTLVKGIRNNGTPWRSKRGQDPFCPPEAGNGKPNFGQWLTVAGFSKGVTKRYRGDQKSSPSTAGAAFNTDPQGGDF